MKRAIKHYIVLVLLFLSCTIATFAQNSNFGHISITANELAQRGDSLYVKLSVDLSGVNVDAQRTLDLVPVLSTGRVRLELPALTIAGSTQYKAYQRNLKLSKKTTQDDGRYDYILTGNKERVVYDYVTLYEPWMETAVLDLSQDLCGCGQFIRRVEIRRLIDKLNVEKKIAPTPYQITPTPAYARPAVEEVKHREISGNARLAFEVSKIAIHPELGNNYFELSKINELIGNVNNDASITIRKITITGYASPEGSLELNRKLSEGRANSLRGYINQHFSIPNNLYQVYFGGEDWDGLVELINASDMNYKQEVLNIISTTTVSAGRETKLMQLRGGDPYRYMLANMFPQLRRAFVNIEYNVKSFDAEEAKRVFEDRPYNLSLNELYTVANMYENGSAKFNEVFDTAVRIFPSDKIANLNAAASALSRNDVVMAERYLQKADTTLPEYYNNMGVLSILKGDYTEARSYIDRAVSMGVTQAADNLKELDKKIESDNQMR